MLENKQILAYDDPSKTFLGVRFILLGFDLVKEDKVRSKLLGGGGIDAVNYGPDCNHVIVDKLVYDDPICIAAQRDGKTLVTGLWVDHSFDVGMPVDPTSVMYRPMRDLNGIPGAKSLVVCLTGYQRQDRDDIMTMVALTGANFSKPLVANKVTHLICYKFEGEKYELAKKIKKIKLVNHRWLEDCLKAWELLPEADYAKSGYELEMEIEAKDSEEETEDMASMDVRKKSVVSPQNTRVDNKSSHQSPVKQEVSRNSFYLSAFESLANVGDTSKIQLTPRKEIDCGIASFSRETHDKHCARSPGNISSEVPPSMLDGTMISEKVEHVLASASGSAKKSPGVGLSKLSSKSWKPSLPLRSERTENNSGSPSASNVNKPGFSGGFGMPSETPQDGTDSHGVKTPLKGTLLHLDEGQTVTLPSKRKTTVSRGSSRSPMSSHYPKASMESEFATKTMEFPVSGSSLDGSHGIAGDISPTSVTCCSREETSLAPIEALNISNTSENRKECNDQVLQRSRERLKKQTLSNLDVKDISSGGTNNCTGGVETHQSDLQSIEEKMDGQAALNFSKVEHCDAQLKPTKKKMLAKKTLGSRPTICKGSTTRHKGLINAILQNEYISHSNGTVAMEDAANATITEKVVMVSPTTNEDGPVDDETRKAPDDEWQNEFDMGSNKENSAEVEAPHSGKDATPTIKQADCKTKQMEQGPKSVGVKNSNEAEKSVCSKKTELPESKSTGDGGEKNITKGKKHPLTKSKTNMLQDPREKVKNDGSKSKQDEKETVSGNEEVVKNTNEAEKSVCSKKIELPESKSTGDGGEKNITKGKKRPLTKSKTNKLKDPREKVKNDGSKSKQDEKKTVPGNEEMVVLAGRTNARPSKKVKSSADVGKENKPATIRQQSVSSGTGEAGKGTSELLKKHLKNGFKADKTNPGNLEMKPEPAWFILSGHKLQRKEYQQVIRRLKGRVCRDSHHWSYQATHFIVPDPIRRTEKIFAAAASGSWILKTDYLTASNEAGRFLSEEPYEWHKKCLTEDGAINLEAPRKWRLLRERTGHGAFYGMQIVIYGECIAPPLDTLKRVVKAGDGTILATSPPYTRFFKSRIDFAIVSPGMPRVDMWIQEFLRHEIPCIVADYLVEYVCKPGYSLERHVQYNTHAWAQKSLENLVNRVEKVEDAKTPEDHSIDDVACQVCGSRDRGEEMLICGDESGSDGCGIGMHVDCLDPPLEGVPEEDWFCRECSQKRETKTISRGSNKRSSKSRK